MNTQNDELLAGIVVAFEDVIASAEPSARLALAQAIEAYAHNCAAEHQDAVTGDELTSRMTEVIGDYCLLLRSMEKACRPEQRTSQTVSTLFHRMCASPRRDG